MFSYIVALIRYKGDKYIRHYLLGWFLLSFMQRLTHDIGWLIIYIIGSAWLSEVINSFAKDPLEPIKIEYEDILLTVIGGATALLYLVIL